MSKSKKKEQAAASEPDATDDRAAEEAADNLEVDLLGLQGELEEANSRVLRTQAELENYRKRVRRDMDEERRYAAMPLLRDLLSVVDNVDRAIAAAEDSEGGAGLLEGVKMVSDQINSILERYNCTKIEAEGAPFDPNFHEAILQQPSADHPPGAVLHEAVVGYKLHDRVVRPSQVIVSTTPPAS